MTIQNQALDGVFRALADPSRRRMVELVSDGRAWSAGELGASFELAQPTVSRHLAVLEQAGLLIRDVKGRRHEFHLGRQRLEQAREWAHRHLALWNHSLDALGTLLEQE